MRKNCFTPVPAGLLGCLMLLTGCGDGEQIRKYPVPTAGMGEDEDHPLPMAGHGGESAGPAASADVATYPARMLVAMAEQGPQTWFFKLLGPVEAVAEHEDEFDQFVQSLKFADGKPQWTTPVGWEPQGQSGLRLETFHVGSHTPPLELTVIPLGTMAGGGDKAILDNLNRWRGQLRLKPIGGDALAEHIERVKTESGAEVVAMDITGEAPTNRAGRPPMSGGPMANRPGGGASQRGPGGSSSSSESEPITYDTPDGWKPGKTNAFRKVAFDIVDGDQQAVVTVIPLPPSGTLANINRWRGQVGLGEITQEQLDKELKTITVDGIEGQMAEMVGEEQTILAAIVNREGRAWFFKLQGDVELAQKEKKAFESFVSSVKFK